MVGYLYNASFRDAADRLHGHTVWQFHIPGRIDSIEDLSAKAAFGVPCKSPPTRSITSPEMA